VSDQSEKTFQLPLVNEGQLAVILAALRMYEADPVRTEHFDGIEEFEDGVDSAFVGELCEYLNCGSGDAAADDGTEKPYSVLMLYPDYLADQYGESTYFAQVAGTSVEAAMAAAQDEAWAAQNPDEDDLGGPADFAVLICVAGHHNDLCPGEGNWERPAAADTGAPAP
jgi:hypothetical protein